MRYSLLSRFRGALVGAALGEVFGFHCQMAVRAKQPLAWLEVDQWGFNAISSQRSLAGWGRVAVDGMQQLIQKNRWDVEKSLEDAGANLIDDSLTNEASIKQNYAHPVSTGFFIATLPLALYFHDDLNQLKEQICRSIALCYPAAKADQDVMRAILIPAYAIALALQEQLKPDWLLADIAADLALAEHSSSTDQLLSQVQHLLQSGTPLITAAAKLQHITTPVNQSSTQAASVSAALSALYGFLKAPDHFKVSLLQTAHLNCQPQVACALVGALAGAYSGVAGLPLNWRRQLDRHPPETSPLSLWGVTTEADLLKLADQLLASWSGVYHPARSHRLDFMPTVAAPDVIRSR